MARLRTAFFCTECGNESARWAGQCPACGAWNALAEEPLARQGARRPVGAGAGPATLSRPIRLADVGEQERVRWSTGMAELDFVLGGGLVPGSLVLLGGEPGIGKSTLLLQLGAALELRGHPTLYVSGEESAAQVGMRAQRLSAGASGVTFLAETSLERIVAQAVEVRPAVLFIDSIQTVHVGELDGAPGSVGQVREAAARLQRFAKESGVAIFLVGHVTKGGAVAGPKTLEHIVDSVLYFEAATGVDHRILRATKNRFGGVDEIGVFRMTPAGLEVVENPSELFLRDRSAPGPGSAVAAVMEGTRPLLVEVQALCATASYGAPQRVSTGFDRQRLALLLAVLETRGGLDFRRLDVFINVVGGLRLAEPAGDLAVVAALASSALERAPPPAAVFIGELGLGGELRAPGQLDRRLAEAARMGFTSAYLPAGRASSSALPRPDASGSSPNGAAIRGVGLATVGELLREAFG